MKASQEKSPVSNTTGPVTGDNSADIVSHPHRLKGLIARKQVRESQLAQQKQTMAKNIGHAISVVEAMRAEDNATFVNRYVDALRSVVEEVRMLNPLLTPDPAIFDELACRVREACAVFIFQNSAAQLRRIVQSHK